LSAHYQADSAALDKYVVNYKMLMF
jgi:hypothetical protein